MSMKCFVQTYFPQLQWKPSFSCQQLWKFPLRIPPARGLWDAIPSALDGRLILQGGPHRLGWLDPNVAGLSTKNQFDYCPLSGFKDLQTSKSWIESRFPGPKRPKIPAKGSCSSIVLIWAIYNCNTVANCFRKVGFIVEPLGWFISCCKLCILQCLQLLPRITSVNSFSQDLVFNVFVLLAAGHHAVILDLHCGCGRILSTF